MRKLRKALAEWSDKEKGEKWEINSEIKEILIIFISFWILFFQNLCFQLVGAHLLSQREALSFTLGILLRQQEEPLSWQSR